MGKTEEFHFDLLAIPILGAYCFNLRLTPRGIVNGLVSYVPLPDADKVEFLFLCYQAPLFPHSTLPCLHGVGLHYGFSSFFHLRPPGDSGVGFIMRYKVSILNQRL